MRVINRLKKRSVEKEYMDDFSSGGAELHEALQHLRRLNRIFGAAGPTLHGFKQLWERSGRPRKLTVIDTGAGSGDVNRRILRWADQQGIQIHITLIDLTREACEEARRLFECEPRIKVEQHDLFELEANSADIVISSQFLHHFDDEELPHVVGHMLKVSRQGVVISDIHRHLISWAAVWITARLVSGNRYIRHDGPLSVAKGFKSSDWIMLKQCLKESVGEPGLQYSWKPLFRYAVVIPKS